MIDYADVIADLEGKKGAIDEILSGFKRLAGTAPERPVPVAPARQLHAAAPVRHVTRRAHRKAAKPTPKPATRAPEKSSGVSLSQRIAERDGIAAAAKAAGVKYGVMWWRAKAGGWKVAKRHYAASAGAAKKPGRKTKAIPTEDRICDACQQHTRQDPCSPCGTARKRPPS